MRATRFCRPGLVLFGVVALATGACPAQAQFTFNLIDPTNVQANNPAAYNGFVQAAARWSSIFTDNMTVNLQIGFTGLGSGILGQTSSTQATYNYSNVRSALVTDATSADDVQANLHLNAGASVNMLLNYTSNSPNGSGSAIPYLDNNGNANNTTIRMTNANAKALGLLSGTNAATDASITFSSSFSFDFDPTNGITSGQYDFVGVATHEIGHALGFISGVDVLDQNSSSTFFTDSQFTYVSTLDLFRYSTNSAALNNNTIDWTAGSTPKYFSIDGGATNIANFALGTVHGDGSQASHWKDNLGIGIMDPTAAPGELLAISANDRRAFDVIGYNLKTSIAATPEPSGVAVAIFGGLGIARLSLRARRSKKRK